MSLPVDWNADRLIKYGITKDTIKYEIINDVIKKQAKRMQSIRKPITFLVSNTPA